ncbi:MAG: protein-glutamine gamma-glutamyltransferase [Paenibacillus sp.]|jgi:protein-glutamine gamma-glutamyltransferase|nr:protein-glutamine gamma-glutamyltransferase [Paenibacillus sp.]
MILIAGVNTPIDSSSMSGIEQEALASKQRSQVVYNYNSLEQLLFELKLRAGTVQSALDLGRSGAVFAPLRHSRCNGMYWIRTDMGGFQLRRGVRPSDAIRDIFINGSMYAFECASAVIIIMYKAVLDLIGDDLFNRYFENLLLMTTHSDNDLGLTTIQTRTEKFVGDVVYIANPDYDRNKPEWSGENLIKVGENAYFGHGIGVKTAEGVIADLNKLRRRWARRSAYMLDQATFPNAAYLYSLTTAAPEAMPYPARQNDVGREQVVRILARTVQDSAVAFR